MACAFANGRWSVLTNRMMSGPIRPSPTSPETWGEHGPHGFVLLDRLRERRQLGGRCAHLAMVPFEM